MIRKERYQVISKQQNGYNKHSTYDDNKISDDVMPCIILKMEQADLPIKYSSAIQHHIDPNV